MASLTLAARPARPARQARQAEPAQGSDVLPCASDPDLFFAEHPEDLLRAKALCGGCPLRLSCLDGALQRGEPWGVWGGELVQRGVVTAHKRPRGRPRKASAAA